MVLRCWSITKRRGCSKQTKLTQGSFSAVELRGKQHVRKLGWLLLGFGFGLFGASGPYEANRTSSRHTEDWRGLLSTVSPPRIDLDNVEPIEPLGEQKTVLVTGAGGFIGSHVAEFLLRRGDNVIAVDDINDDYNLSIKENNLKILEKEGEVGPAKTPKGTLKIFRGDMADIEFVTEVFAETNPDYVCHLAERSGIGPPIEDAINYVYSNLKVTTVLLQVISHFAPQIQNFVYASSSSVYGRSVDTYFQESELVDFPISPNAATKKSSELMAYTFHHLYNLSTTGLRFFTIYGPRSSPDMPPFSFVDLLSRGETISQFEDGPTSRDYTFIDDIVNGVIRAIDRPYPFQLFNLGRGQGISLTDFIHLVEKHTGQKAKVGMWPEPAGDVSYKCADISRANRLLGYAPKVGFDEGIRRTVEWYNATYL